MCDRHGNNISFILYTVIDLQIHRVWEERQEQISIWWQVFPLIPVGVAVIQTVPTLDGFVFNLAPTEFKTLGNAINKLVQVALSNQVVKSLYRKVRVSIVLLYELVCLI